MVFIHLERVLKRSIYIALVICKKYVCHFLLCTSCNPLEASKSRTFKRKAGTTIRFPETIETDQ